MQNIPVDQHHVERDANLARIPRVLRKASALGMLLCAYPIFVFWVELIEATRVFDPFSNGSGIAGLLFATIVVIGLAAWFFASPDRALHYPLFIALVFCIGTNSFLLFRILKGAQRDLGQASFLNPSDSWPWMVAGLIGSLAVLISAATARVLQLRTS